MQSVHEFGACVQLMARQAPKSRSHDIHPDIMRETESMRPTWIQNHRECCPLHLYKLLKSFKYECTSNYMQISANLIVTKYLRSTGKGHSSDLCDVKCLKKSTFRKALKNKCITKKEGNKQTNKQTKQKKTQQPTNKETNLKLNTWKFDPP